MRFETWKDAGHWPENAGTGLGGREIEKSGRIAGKRRIKAVSCVLPIRPHWPEPLPNQFRCLFALAKRWQFYTLVVVRAC
jgi:hypothetical protein